jgi:hypothetical protein
MQRTKYFNQTRPTDTQLNWTDQSRVGALSRRMKSFTQHGIVSGYQVNVNILQNTRIDIARGEGYSGGSFHDVIYNGSGSSERISTYTDTPSGEADLGPAAVALALADYTNTASNYVCLVYGENESYALAERSYPFTSHLTVVEETFTAEVLTAVQWTALTAAQLNNRILVAIVTANGVGVALNSGNVTQFTQPKALPAASDPTIPGIEIVTISDNTPYGAGTLRWNGSSLYWTAPGDSEGAGVPILTSGTYTLFSSTVVNYITVSVAFTALSAIVAPGLSETITVDYVYGRDIPMASSVDKIHRDMIGTGKISPTNIHGMSLNDISGGLLDHADYYHRNGITYDSDVTQLATIVNPAIPSVEITNLGGLTNQFLINGRTFTEINGVVPPTSESVAFGGGDTHGRYLVYLDEHANAQKVYVGCSLWPNAGVASVLRIVNIRNSVAGDGILSWDAAARALTWQAPGDGAAGDPVYVGVGTGAPAPAAFDYGYYKLYSQSLQNWIVVFLPGLEDLGVSQVSPLYAVTAIAMTGAAQPDDTILPICSVTWDTLTNSLIELDDIRLFTTADNTVQVREEHDANGNHTIPLRSTLSIFREERGLNVKVASSVGITVQAANVGIDARAQTDGAVAGIAANDTGAWFYASRSVGMQGYAGVNYGVRGDAAGTYGVYGGASNYGVFGIASSDKTAINGSVNAGTGIGVYGICGGASGTGVAGVETHINTGTGVYGSAAGITCAGVYGIATAAGSLAYGGRFVNAGSAATALLAEANGDTGKAVYGRANGSIATGVVGTCTGDTATGVYGRAEGDVGKGVYGYGETGVQGTGVVFGVLGGGVTGVVGIGAVYGVSGTGSVGVGGVGTATGVYGTGADTGGYFKGPIGGYGSGVNTGLYGTGATGVQGVGTKGVVGSGVNYGGSFVNGVCGAYGEGTRTGIYGFGNGGINDTIWGVCGSAVNAIAPASATGVYGRADGIGATGVFGLGVNGLGGSFYGFTCGADIRASANGAVTAMGVYLRAIVPDPNAFAYGVRADALASDDLGKATALYGSASAGSYAVGAHVRGTASGATAFGLVHYALGSTAYGIYGAITGNTAYGYTAIVSATAALAVGIDQTVNAALGTAIGARFSVVGTAQDVTGINVIATALSNKGYGGRFIVTATADDAIGVYASVVGSVGVAVHGTALVGIAITGTALYGTGYIGAVLSGDAVGVIASASYAADLYGSELAIRMSNGIRYECAVASQVSAVLGIYNCPGIMCLYDDGGGVATYAIPLCSTV